MAGARTAVIDALRRFYGRQPRPPSDPFQFFLWETVAQHALPARRDLAWQALSRIPALTPDAMFRAAPADVLAALGLAGAHRDEKLELIRATVEAFRRHRESLSVTALRGSLRGATRVLARLLPHVPLDVRRRALLVVGRHQVLPLDADLRRVSSRLLGHADAVRRADARGALTRQLPADVDVWCEAVVLLRHHARHTCVAVAPHCAVCPLARQCRFVVAPPAPRPPVGRQSLN